ncbi:MAG TPA: NAD(P)/FAD-dependent oxidoreductase [Candidatus Dormibacteraeota bacterium]|nr:NAD(P)/FAD-dependent oxidoreductase [Candidatus Dormibacteraeota bacterium]
MKPVDVVILGGGPAGLATGIAARRKGLSATVVDCAGPPIDKTCGEGLLPAAVSALAELGITLDPHLGIPFKGIRFSDEKSSAEARFASGHGIGLRRDELHRMLVDRAAAAGVSLRWGARVSEIQRDGLRIEGEFHRCRWLIGADGHRSAVRKAAGLDPTRLARRLRFGFRRHFAVAPWSEMVEVYWGERVQLFITPTGAEDVCVVALTSDPHLRLDRALARFPRIAARLRRARAVGRETGAVTCFSRARRVAWGNIALVGDASRSIDAISGQGLSMAFQEAIALAGAMASGSLADYQSAHACVTNNPARMTRLLMLMHGNATFRRMALKTLSSCPWLFSTLMSIHAGGARVAHNDVMGQQLGGKVANLDDRLWEHN